RPVHIVVVGAEANHCHTAILVRMTPARVRDSICTTWSALPVRCFAVVARIAQTSRFALGRAGESDVVADHGGRTNGHHLGSAWSEWHLLSVCSGHLYELESLLGDLSNQIFEGHDRELFAGAAPVAEAKRGEAGVVANGQRAIVGDGEHGAKPAVVHCGLTAVLDIERR